MVFYFYEDAMKTVDKVSVDGLVPNSAHLSHWQGNQTPEAFKADTSTEIVLRYLRHPDRKSLFPQFGIITNDHFDADGLLAVWSMLNHKKAEALGDRLIACAEAGDFATFSSEEGLQVALLIDALCHDKESPLFEQIEAYSGPPEAAYYKHLLPLVPELFRKKDQYRSLWQKPFEKVLADIALFDKGLMAVEEYEEEKLTVIVNPRRPAKEAIDYFCLGNLFLLVEDHEQGERRFGYELEYRYYSWAETQTRPIIPHISMKALAEKLNATETSSEGQWVSEGYAGRGLTSVLKFTDVSGVTGRSRLHPETVVPLVLAHIRSEAKKDESAFS